MKTFTNVGGRSDRKAGQKLIKYLIEVKKQIKSEVLCVCVLHAHACTGHCVHGCECVFRNTSVHLRLNPGMIQDMELGLRNWPRIRLCLT